MSPLTPERALIFRITHIENVAWALANGLHCKSSGNLDPNYREIGNQDLISRRADREVPIPPGGTLSDYIPFYFTPYSPMMLNIKTGYGGMQQTPMKDIAIFVSSLHKVAEMGLEFVFSDRHALLHLAQFSSDLNELGRIDWKILQARDFKRNPNDLGKVERYQAEALIYQRLPVNALMGIICYSEPQRQRVSASAEEYGARLEIKAMPGWYV